MRVAAGIVIAMLWAWFLWFVFFFEPPPYQFRLDYPDIPEREPYEAPYPEPHEVRN